MNNCKQPPHFPPGCGCPIGYAPRVSRTVKLSLAAVVAAALTLTACGGDDDCDDASGRTVSIELASMVEKPGPGGGGRGGGSKFSKPGKSHKGSKSKPGGHKPGKVKVHSDDCDDD